MTDLDGFARQRRRQFAGQALEVRRLTGFCLLIRQAVLTRIGGRLDEQFGLGFCEDDDVCMRIHQAGLKLYLAQDVFIHHFGNKTFQALGIKPEEQLRENLQRLRQKWGEQATAPYRLPNGVASARTTTYNGSTQAPVAVDEAIHVNGRPKVSLCVIARNEEKNLPECLGPLRGVVDEIVVLDTGSTDNTKQVAASFGAAGFRDALAG